MYSIEEASGMAIVPFRKPILFFAVRDTIIALDQLWQFSAPVFGWETNWLPRTLLLHRKNGLRDGSSILAKAWPAEEEEFVVIGLVEFSVEAIDELRAPIPC